VSVLEIFIRILGGLLAGGVTFLSLTYFGVIDIAPILVATIAAIVAVAVVFFGKRAYDFFSNLLDL
jgi:hypothetical protein